MLAHCSKVLLLPPVSARPDVVPAARMMAAAAGMMRFRITGLRRCRSRLLGERGAIRRRLVPGASLCGDRLPKRPFERTGYSAVRDNVRPGVNAALGFVSDRRF